MVHNGRSLGAADLPRLERSMASLKKTIAQLKKECGLTSSKVLSQIEFWDMYAEAVRKIRSQPRYGHLEETWLVQQHRRALGYSVGLGWDRMPPVYGDMWKIHAKPDETVMVTLPAPLCKGTAIRNQSWGSWRRDQRLPAAQFWPNGQLPDVKMIFAEPPPSEWSYELGQPHPMEVALTETVRVDQEARDEKREIIALHSALDISALERKMQRDDNVYAIVEDAGEMELLEVA